MNRFAAVLLLSLPSVALAEEPGWVTLFSGKNLDAWHSPAKEWYAAGEIALQPDNPRRLVGKPGEGALVNGKGRTANLVSKEAYTDLAVHVEFLIPRGSNSGVKLMGRYEIQIYDSHGRKELTGSDCGGVYPRGEMLPKYHTIDKGVPPRTNACRPAGEWQTLDIEFRAAAVRRRRQEGGERPVPEGDVKRRGRPRERGVEAPDRSGVAAGEGGGEGAAAIASGSRPGGVPQRARTAVGGAPSGTRGRAVASEVVVQSGKNPPGGPPCRASRWKRPTPACQNSSPP